jgi:hypothetical protein
MAICQDIFWEKEQASTYSPQLHNSKTMGNLVYRIQVNSLSHGFFGSVEASDGTAMEADEKERDYLPPRRSRLWFLLHRLCPSHQGHK